MDSKKALSMKDTNIIMLMPFARLISRLVIASTSEDFKDSLTVLQLIVITGWWLTVSAVIAILFTMSIAFVKVGN
jgi:uncharacterized membrane protein YbhN (UPF0104 family)